MAWALKADPAPRSVTTDRTMPSRLFLRCFIRLRLLATLLLCTNQFGCVCFYFIRNNQIIGLGSSKMIVFETLFVPFLAGNSRTSQSGPFKVILEACCPQFCGRNR